MYIYDACIFTLFKYVFHWVIIVLHDTHWFLLFLSTICPLTPALDCVYNKFSPFIFKLMGLTINFIGPLYLGSTIMEVPTQILAKSNLPDNERSQSIMSKSEYSCTAKTRIQILDLHKSVLRVCNRN